MSPTKAEVLLSVLVYAVSLSVASLSNVWLSVWGRRLSVLNSYFRSHQPLLGDDEDSVRIDPFDLAALEASLSAAASATAAQSTDAATEADVCGYRAVNPSPVFDLGLHFLPHLHYRWLPDAFVFLLLPLLLAAVFVPTATPPRRRYHWPPVLARLCCVLQSHSVVLLMRSSTTLATVHRASPVCHALSLESAANPGFVLNTGCFDLMFSGHTAFCVLAAFYTCQRTELGWLARLLVALLAVAGSVSNVLVGDHFTADMLVGAHIALLVCCLFRQHFQVTLADQTGGVQQTAIVADADATHTAPRPKQQTSDASSHHPTHSTRGVNRATDAATDEQPMDVDEQRSAQRTQSPVHDGMEVDADGGLSGAGHWSERGLSELDQCVEEKELQRLLNQWQLADSYNAATATAFKRHTRRHTTF